MHCCPAMIRPEAGPNRGRIGADCGRPERGLAAPTLARTLRGHLDLGKCRLDSLCIFVVGMVAARSVTLGHIATAAGRSVLIASTCRRLQRFFQHVGLDPDWTGPNWGGGADWPPALFATVTPNPKVAYFCAAQW